MSSVAANAARRPRLGPLPRYSVGLVQSEVEMLHTPGNELSAFLLEREDSWEVRTYTERTAKALLNADTQFDCIVLGFNAVYQSEALRAALVERMPATGLLVLHQLKQGGIDFLTPDLRVRLAEMAEEARNGVRQAVVPREGRPEDEILLNWPLNVLEEQKQAGEDGSFLGDGVRGSAICHVETQETAVWRTSLEVDADQRRLPVVLRTSGTRKPPVVVCTLLLEPRRKAHAAILTNMIMYCAAGWPDVVIVRDSGSVERRDIARKLRLQGTNAIEVLADAPDELRFDDWPLRMVREVIVAEQWDVEDVLPSAGCERWLETGGTLVTIEKKGLLLRHGASDPGLVAQQWAAWFNAVHPARWHGGKDLSGEKHDGSIFQTRAVLRMLALIERGKRLPDPGRLGLLRPSEFRSQVLALVGKRLQKRFEGTISTAAAARDVLRLLDGGDPRGEILDKRVSALLREWFPDAAHEDQFDIARALADPELFAAAVEKLRERKSGISTVLRTRIWDAASASGTRPDLSGLRDLPDPELDSNLLLAAEYLAAFARLDPADRDRAAEGERLDRALATIGRYGVLARRIGATTPVDPLATRAEEIGTEAFALIHYLELDPTSTNVMRKQAQGIPPGVVEAVLKESRRSRAMAAEAETVRPSLRLAQHIFGVMSILAASGIGAFALVRLGFSITNLGSAVLAGSFVLIGLLLLLRHFDLAPPWREQAAALFEGGLTGIPAALGKRLRTSAQP